MFRTYFINGRGDEAMEISGAISTSRPLAVRNFAGSARRVTPIPLLYKRRKWHDNYDAEAAPDQKWVKVSDVSK